MKNELGVLIFHVLNLPCWYRAVMTVRYLIEANTILSWLRLLIQNEQFPNFCIAIFFVFFNS